VVIAPVVVMAIVMGLFPTLFLAPTAPAIDKLVQGVWQGQQMRAQRAVNLPVDALGAPSTANRQPSTGNRQ
jgi:hypothetical protein